MVGAQTGELTNLNATDGSCESSQRKRHWQQEKLGLPIQLWIQVGFELCITLAYTRNVNKQPDAEDDQPKVDAA